MKNKKLEKLGNLKLRTKIEAFAVSVLLLLLIVASSFANITISNSGMIDSSGQSMLTDGASFIIFTDGTTTYAKNGTSGMIDSYNTNSTIVFQYVFGNVTSGDKIQVKKGTYEINTKLTLDSTQMPIYLEGQGSMLDWDRVGTVLNASSLHGNMIEVGGDHVERTSGFHMTGFAMELSGQTLGAGVEIHNPVGCFLRELWIKEPHDVGIKLMISGAPGHGGATGCCNTIFHCRVDTSGGTGIISDGVYSKVILNLVQGSIGAAGNIVVNGAQTLVMGNTIMGGSSDVGISIIGAQCRVIGNFVSLCDNHGIRLQSDNNLISGNYLYNNNQGNAPNSADIRVLDSSNNSITGNHIKDTAGKMDYGIYETGTSDGNAISNNYMSGHTNAEISVVGANTTICNNPGYNNNSLFPFYKQNTAPSIHDNCTAYWYDTDDSYMYQIVQTYGTTYYVNMTTTI